MTAVTFARLRSSGARVGALPGALLALSLATPASAQERWHEVPIAPLPEGATLDDLAFHDGVGFLALRDGDGAGHVLELRFPDDDGPAFEDTALPPLAYTQPLLVSFHGTHVVATTPILPVAVLDVVAGGWDTTTYAPPPTSSGAQQVEADAAGGARFLAVPNFVSGSQAVYFHGTTGWTRHRVDDSSSAQLVLLRGPRAVAVSASGGLHVTDDVAGLNEGDAWSDLGEVVVGQQAALAGDVSGAWLDERSVAAVLSAGTGSWALFVTVLDDGGASWADCSDEVTTVAPLGFRRVAAAGGVLYALDGGGRVHRIEGPESCSSWSDGTVSAPFFVGAVGLGAVDAQVALAAGHRASDGVPVLVWRNRAPRLAPLADVTLDEGSELTLPVVATDPDPADRDALTVAGTCDDAEVELLPGGGEVTLRAAPFAQACAGAASAVACTLTVSDGELSASQSFIAHVEDADGLALPSPPALERAGDEEVLVPIGGDGVEVTLEVRVVDACADENTVTWDLEGLPPALRPSGATQVVTTSRDERRALTLSAPFEDALALDGSRAEVLARVSSDDGGEDGAVRFELRFVRGEDLAADAVVEVSLSAPSTRALALGDVVQVDAALSSSLRAPLPSLRVTLADGELAILDEGVELGDSPCGANGRVRRADGGIVVEADGVREGCPLPFRLLARKGLAREPLRVTSCTWGDGEVIERCAGALSTARPRALGCAQLTPSSTLTLSSLLALLALLRRRRR